MTQETAILVCLKLNAWTGKKRDRAAAAEYTESKNAAGDAATVDKALVSAEFLRDVQAIDNQIRAAFYRLTFNYAATSIRILPEKGRKRFEETMAALFTLRAACIDTMLSGYDAERERSRDRLGDMFNESQYPTADAVRQRYAARFIFLPMPAGWKTGIDDEALQNAVADARKEAMATARTDAWQRIIDVTESMVEKLAAYVPAEGDNPAKNVFRDSVVTNIKEMVEYLEDMASMFESSVLNAAIETLKNEIANVAPEALRHNDAMRRQIKAIAETVLADARFSIDRESVDTREPAPVPTPAEEPIPVSAPAIPASEDFDVAALLD